ncbi:hypothetical protein MA16_Dca016982 [Dendrobium catenatum]|uniref:Uncharacterized protein n=1 Tax=Dendrobium catenatum TaxID=906689 RepID=A0A2I0VWM4_9ASPA|nr:hypothetical protein MA16_Dca016982 [Dendrobium catenatum]
MKETTRCVLDTVEVLSADRHGFQGSDGVFARQVSLRISFRFFRWMDYLHEPWTAALKAMEYLDSTHNFVRKSGQQFGGENFTVPDLWMQETKGML